MKLNIAVLAGDGIGPEIMKQGLLAVTEREVTDFQFTLFHNLWLMVFVRVIWYWIMFVIII